MLYKDKSGNIYRYLATGIDSTSSRAGTLVVIFCPDDDEHTVFVREETEFYEKFKVINEETRSN